MSEKQLENNQTDTPHEVSELKNIVEAAIFAASEPLSVRKLISLFPDDAQPTKEEIKEVIDRIESDYADCGVGLVKLGQGWRFRSKEKYSTWLRRLSINNPPRFSRALLETLSIIAYRQPVTRGDIEDIRGVAVSTDIIRAIEDRGWITEIGHRDVPGRPALFGTTSEFLEYFGLESLRELPELMQPRELIEVAKEMNLTLPEANKTPVQDQAEPDESESAQASDQDSKELDNNSTASADDFNQGEQTKEGADIIPLHPDEKDPS